MRHRGIQRRTCSSVGPSGASVSRRTCNSGKSHAAFIILCSATPSSVRCRRCGKDNAVTSIVHAVISSCCKDTGNRLQGRGLPAFSSCTKCKSSTIGRVARTSVQLPLFTRQKCRVSVWTVRDLRPTGPGRQNSQSEKLTSCRLRRLARSSRSEKFASSQSPLNATSNRLSALHRLRIS